ncbi:DEAD/DEAH box helicase [Nocardia sp. NPDC050717]|uniref:DEAD/DEAH box helicase n=1 Tax=Nocardia sp. NPDC050717 TaxID=3157221 RepID=UPI0033F100AD
MTRKARTLSKITVEQEPGLTDTLLTAELDNTHIPPSFAELGVRSEIVRALGEIGIERTFAIQELTLPLALAGEDLIGQARTGMGKTFGFGVPLLHRIATADTGTTPLDGTPRALVIVPTRELCIQVTKDLENASKYLTNHQGSLKVAAIYGGRPYDTQIAALREGVDVVVGTPGRLLDLANQNHLILGKIGVLVLDEADEMLDLGFLPDIERILSMVPDKRQTMLFSATMPGPIITLARTFLTRPTHIRAELANDSAVHDRTAQFVYRAHALDKSELVARVLQAESRGATMIFTRTKRTAQKVADDLAERGFAVGAVHGDLGQIAREKALTKFRKGSIDVLVATDVAARGIDIDDVTHVINYQCPEDEKTYVHRIGRTGRAGRTGVAITLIDWDELHRWASIDKALGLGIPDPAETYSRSPHLYADLGIPEGVTGVIRKPKPVREEGDVVEERAERPKSTRSRRRTRGGKATEATATEATESATDAAPAEDGAEGDKPARRRRRRRKPAEGEATVTESATASAPIESAPAASGDAQATTGDAQAEPATGDQTKPARRRRRRTSAESGESTTETSAPATAETAPDETDAAPARRRRRTSAESAESGESGESTAEASTPATAEAAPDETDAAPARRRRRRKPAESASADSPASADNQVTVDA